MSIQKIIRAWKDEVYRESLSNDDIALLPKHPAGLLELTDEDLGNAASGVYSFPLNSCHIWCKI